MGQKSNILTIRKKNRIELVIDNSRIWVTIFKLLQNFSRFLFLKNVFITKYLGVLDNNCFQLSINLFYITKKILYLKKKFLKFKQKKMYFIKKSVTRDEFINTAFSFQHLDSYKLRFTVLNSFVKNRVLRFLFTKLKRYRFNIFSRRLFFFYDFLKLTALFLENRIDLEYYTQVWARILKNISKRLHGRFITFIKILFVALIQVKSIVKNLAYSFLGAKFSIKGRLRAKDRASSKLIQVGSVSPQSISLPVEYSSSHVHTLYGIFGIKIWTLKKKLDYVNTTKTKIQKISKR